MLLSVTEEVEMDGACSMYKGEENCIHGRNLK